MLQKLREDEPQAEQPQAELDNLGHADWARLWVQLMRELRHGVKLKKVQEQEFNPLPTEFQLTPFEMLMQDIRARNYKLRKVMVSWADAPASLPPRLCIPDPCAGPAEPHPGHSVTRAGGGRQGAEAWGRAPRPWGVP
ncbi:protein spire homolog 2-like [Pteropus vampyrus]|uniref:Protein spire homolog 2-like n=1 Tax=Pteropus vampyrus TaxID=132908 RepID=A0A6P3RT05_PTEVA|nr:protein spire homolog 2-like [Pteropus vampyrus]